MKIITILGARPQFIKASVVTAAFSKRSDIEEVMVHTGQHFDSNMSDVFFSDLEIPAPRYQLDIHGGSHGAMTGMMLAEIEKVLMNERPDTVLVYGDTNSTLAGALAAAKLRVPVAHVEAGLRSFNMAMPEEINRVLADRISHWLFTPTEAAAQHLRQEGFSESQIFPVGDVMYDVALQHGARVRSDDGILGRTGLKPKEYVLATIHRAENTDCPRRLTNVVKALELVARFIPVVWPLHPRTRTLLQRAALFEELSKKLHLIEPVGYLEMIQLEKFASVIATDSGGVQKEAFFYQVPCVTLRDETEWVELIDAKWNRLAPPTDAESVAATIKTTIGSRGTNVSPYGDGGAAVKIVGQLKHKL